MSAEPVSERVTPRSLSELSLMIWKLGAELRSTRQGTRYAVGRSRCPDSPDGDGEWVASGIVDDVAAGMLGAA
jgi:hypothetical protein